MRTAQRRASTAARRASGARTGAQAARRTGSQAVPAVERRTPVRLDSISNIVQIGTGRLHTLAVGAGGGVWAWGDNDFGQLGDGSHTDRHAPVKVANVTAGEQVAGGRDYSAALVGN